MSTQVARRLTPSCRRLEHGHAHPSHNRNAPREVAIDPLPRRPLAPGRAASFRKPGHAAMSPLPLPALPCHTAPCTQPPLRRPSPGAGGLACGRGAPWLRPLGPPQYGGGGCGGGEAAGLLQPLVGGGALKGERKTELGRCNGIAALTRDRLRVGCIIRGVDLCAGNMGSRAARHQGALAAARQVRQRPRGDSACTTHYAQCTPCRHQRTKPRGTPTQLNPWIHING